MVDIMVNFMSAVYLRSLFERYYIV